MRYRVFILLWVHFAAYASAIPNFNDTSKCKNVTFFLSTPKSGTNLISASLSAITRKPIWWLNWGPFLSQDKAYRKEHLSYNRLKLPLITEIPLLYRTHYEFAELMRVPSEENKLIFLTRNPKELIFRSFFLTNPSLDNPEISFIQEFLDKHLKAFKVFGEWFSETRFLVFYEDFIERGDEILVELLHFMEEEPLYLDDFLNNKQEYMSRLLDSYTKQHVHNSGGSSSQGGPKPIYYSRNASIETLTYIDEYIKSVTPTIWESYLKRFQSDVEP